MITVIYMQNPFRPQDRVIKRFVPDDAKTLQDVISAFCVEKPDDYVFLVNSFHVSNFENSIPLGENDFVVIAPNIRGGGGGRGSKNVVGLIAGLALMAFAPGAGSGLLGIMGTTQGAIGLGAAMYFGGAMMIGNQKMPSIDAPKVEGAFDGGYGWSPDTVQLRPGAAVPETYGTIRTSGQLLARQIVGGQAGDGKATQILSVLIAAGAGELDSIANIKVNGVLIADNPSISVETKLGTNNQTPVNIGGLSSIVEQQAFSSLLANDTTGNTWVTKAMTEPGERVRLDFVFASGLYGVSTSNGATFVVVAYLQGQYREVGSSTWLSLFDNPTSTLNLSSGQRRSPSYTWESFTPPDTSKLYEFRFNNYTLRKYRADGQTWTEMPSNYSVDITWASVTVINQTSEQSYPGIALVALQIPATQGLSGSMPKISWEQTRANIWAWNPDEEEYQQKPANNIAWMCYDIIHGCRKVYNIQTSAYEFVVHGEPKENLNYATFDEWATYLGTEVEGVARGVGNLLFDSAEQMFPAVQKLASVGRGFVIQPAGVFKPVWDAPKIITQTFGAGNIIAGSQQGDFLSLRERATAIEASFIDQDDEFERNPGMLVKGDDFKPMSLDNPTQIYFPALTSSKAVHRLCKHMLRKNKYLIRTQAWKADIDSIVAEMGDCVGVQSDISKWGVSGRIQGSTSTQLVIDQNVTMQPGTTYSILVRLENGTLTRKTVDAVLVETTTNALNFTGSAWSPVPERYCFYSFGVNNLEVKPFIITDIRRDGDFRATIEGIEYVEGIYSDDNDFPVIDYTAANASISSLTVKADNEDGKLRIAWPITEASDYLGALVFVNGKPQGFLTVEKDSLDIDVTNGEYTVSVVPVDGRGKEGTAIEDTVTVATPVLSSVSGISLASSVRQQADGTSLIFLTGSFTIPVAANSVLVEIGEGSSPSTWTTLQDSRVDAISYGPVKPGTVYVLRFTARNKYSTAEPVLEDVTAAGDTTAPGAPVIAATSSLKNVKINISLGTVPGDMAGFEIYRNTSNSSSTATKIGSITSKDGEASFIDSATNYGDVLYYWVKSFDLWGNKSAFSDPFGPITISMILSSDVSPEAIKQAIGSVASWSAKNCTTASIAEASGVKDVSGNGNHGRAYGGVEVVNSEMGQAFQFDGVDDYIELPNNLGYIKSVTALAWFKRTGVPKGGVYHVIFGGEQLEITVYYDGRLIIGVATSSGRYVEVLGSGLADGEFHMLAVTFSGSTITAYADGVKIGERGDVSGDLIYSFSRTIGKWSSDEYFANGIIAQPRIYSRALSATEIKSLYMFPGDVAFGRITADLVTTGELITLSAQIADAIIGNAKITDLSAAKINAGTLDAARIAAGSISTEKLDAGAVTAEKINVSALKLPTGSSGAWNAKGATAASIVISGGIKDTSGNNNHATATAGVTVGRDAYKDSYFLIDASSERLNIATPITAGTITASIWVYRSASASSSYKALFCHDTDNIFHVLIDPDWVLCVFDGSVRLSTYTIPDDANWHMVTFILVSATSAAIYVDGAYHSTISTTLNLTTYPVGCIGGTPFAGYHAGYIADPIVFSRALSAAEIKTLYMLGTDSESGTITADRVVTGQIKSLNYSTTAGSLIDLDSGDIKMGGSSAPRFSFTNSTNTGVFAGFTFNATDMTAGSGATAIGISTDTGKMAFWAGSATPASATFRVTHAGAMTATSGNIGGFELSTDRIGAFSPLSLGGGCGIKLSEGFSHYNNTSFVGQGVLCAKDQIWQAYSDLYGHSAGFNVSANRNSSTAESAAVVLIDVDSVSKYAIKTTGKIKGDTEDTSDERMKSGIVPVNTLEKLKSLPVTEWHYDDDKIRRRLYEDQVETAIKTGKPMPIVAGFADKDIEDYRPKDRHIGPMAKDFNQTFGTNAGSESGINLSDAIGVALRSIQELASIVDKQSEELKNLKKLLKAESKQETELVAEPTTAAILIPEPNKEN